MAVPEIPTPCAIDPTHGCACASSDFAKDMFEHVVQSLMEKYKMTEEDAIAEYQKGDKYIRGLAVPDKVSQNCPFSPIKKFAVNKDVDI